MIKLSIIIPIYKVEKYIQRCITSILSQHIENFEVECILVDDYTPDESMKIAKKTISDYTGNICFRFLKHEINKGLSEARNTGIRNATGEYILFIDSDDYLMPDSLNKMMQMKNLNPDVDIIIGNVYEHKYKKTQYNIANPIVINNGIEARKWMLTHEYAVSAWNKLFNREFIIENNLFFEPGILHEDIPWTCILYSKISSILLLPEVTYSYWYNPTSISSTSKPSDKTISSYVRGCQLMLDIPYEKTLFVSKQLYIFRSLLNASNARNSNSSEEVLSFFYSIRSQFIKQTLCNGRYILLSFFTLLYFPFNLILKIHAFRRYYNNISKIVEWLANKFNYLH